MDRITSLKTPQQDEYIRLNCIINILRVIETSEVIFDLSEQLKKLKIFRSLIKMNI